jgi:hypothetical protein
MAVVRRVDSTGNYNIVNTGIFDEVSPITAGSLSFNGSSQYLTLPMSTAFVLPAILRLKLQFLGHSLINWVDSIGS